MPGMDEQATLTIALRDAISQSLRGVAAELDNVSSKAQAIGSRGSQGVQQFNQEISKTSQAIQQLNSHLSNAQRFTLGFVRGMIGAGLGTSLVQLSRSMQEFSRGAIDMQYLGRETRLTTERIMQLTQAGARLGMSSHEVHSAIESVTGKLIDLQRGSASATYQGLARMPGGPEWAAQLRRQVQSGDVDAAMMAVFDRMANPRGGYRATRQIAELFGIPERMEDMREALARNMPMMVASAHAAKEFNNQMVDLDVRVQNIKYTIGNAMLPTLTRLSERLQATNWGPTKEALTFIAEKGVLAAEGLNNLFKIIQQLDPTAPGGALNAGPVGPAYGGPSRVGPEGLVPLTMTRMRNAVGLASGGVVPPGLRDDPREVVGPRGLVPLTLEGMQDRLGIERPPMEPLTMDALRGRLGLRGRGASRALRGTVRPEDAAASEGFNPISFSGGFHGITLSDLLRVELSSNKYLEDMRNAMLGEAGGGAGGGPGSNAAAGAGPTFRRGIGPGARAGGFGGVGGAGLGGAGGPAQGALRDRIAMFKSAAMDQLAREGVPEANREEAANLLAGQGIMESGLNPNAVHDQGTGYGIYGARLDRRSRMLSWMRENGYEPNSLEGQTKYMAHEAMSGGYGRTRQALMNATPANREALTNTITGEFGSPARINRRSGAVGQAAGVNPDATPHGSGMSGLPTGGAAGQGDTGGALPAGVLARARQVALTSGPGGVQRFMAANGFPMAGNWCGEFAAAVVRSEGGRPPQNPAIASNWRNFGVPVEGPPQPGDVAVRRGPRTGATGSHVTFVQDFDPATGIFHGVGGNQGSRWVSPYSANRFDFRRMMPDRAALDRANAGAGGPLGKAQIDVNVSAPRGTKVDAAGDKFFEKINMSRTPQMPKAAGGSDTTPNYEFQE
jgi:hypothetical protein